MIRKSIEKGTTVWHEALGAGVFVSMSPEMSGDFMRVQFDDGIHHVHRKRLTEIETKEEE